MLCVTRSLCASSFPKCGYFEAENPTKVRMKSYSKNFSVILIFKKKSHEFDCDNYEMNVHIYSYHFHNLSTIFFFVTMI